MVRNIAAAALMVVAVVFWFGPALGGASGIDGYEDAIDDALAADVLNNTRTEGAPQQQVVNGWTARDLLEVQARQTNDLLQAQNRLASLLAVSMIGIGLLAFSGRSTRRIDPPVDEPPSPPTSTVQSA